MTIWVAPGRQSDVSLLVLSFNDSMTIWVNGRRAALASLNEMRKLRWIALPTLARIDPESVWPGLNQIRITVTAHGDSARLGRVYFGTYAELQPYYQPRWFVAAVFPTLLCGAELAFAIVFALIWAARRHETAFGWLAIVLFGGALHGSVLIPDFGLSIAFVHIWNWTLLWEALACLLFVRAIAGKTGRRRDWLWAMPPVLVCLATILGPTPVISGPALVASALLVIAMLIAALASLVPASVRGNQDALIVLIGMVVLVIFTLHDTLMVFGFIEHSAYVGRIGLAGFMVTLSTLMTLRFTRAMREVDRTADLLRERVQAAETRLRETYEELRLRREAEAIERERARLMRDLHDGVGSELVTMLALADSPRPRSTEIASHARAALSDMRLIISSLEDYGGDLTLALASWRERAAPQLRAAKLALDWQVKDLPLIANLGPSQVLDILRIVQEAVTNVIKHAGAQRVVLEAHMARNTLSISIRDDGAGITGEFRGHGFRNMHERASRLNGRLTIARKDNQTEVLLHIPPAEAR